MDDGGLGYCSAVAAHWITVLNFPSLSLQRRIARFVSRGRCVKDEVQSIRAQLLTTGRSNRGVGVVLEKHGRHPWCTSSSGHEGKPSRCLRLNISSARLLHRRRVSRCAYSRSTARPSSPSVPADMSSLSLRGSGPAGRACNREINVSSGSGSVVAFQHRDTYRVNTSSPQADHFKTLNSP